MAKKTLNERDDVKLFVIQLLAERKTPTKISAAVQQKFGVDISRQAIQAYDPTRYAGRNLSAQHKEMFTEQRMAYEKEYHSHAMSSRTYRFNAYQRMLEIAMPEGNNKGDLSMAHRIWCLIFQENIHAHKVEGGLIKGMPELEALREEADERKRQAAIAEKEVDAVMEELLAGLGYSAQSEIPNEGVDLESDDENEDDKPPLVPE